MSPYSISLYGRFKEKNSAGNEVLFRISNHADSGNFKDVDPVEDEGDFMLQIMEEKAQ